MQIFLFRDSKGNAVHGSDTKKKTGCGINLQRPDNMAKFTVEGTVDDAFGLMSKVTCEKCQTVFTQKILKADRKEMNRMLKEEKKRAKTMGDDPNIVNLAEVQKTERKKQAAAPVPAPAPVETPVQEAAPAVPDVPEVPEVPAAYTEPPVQPAAEPDESPVPAFEQYVPPVKKPAAPAAPAASGFPPL